MRSPTPSPDLGAVLIVESYRDCAGSLADLATLYGFTPRVFPDAAHACAYLSACDERVALAFADADGSRGPEIARLYETVLARSERGYLFAMITSEYLARDGLALMPEGVFRLTKGECVGRYFDAAARKGASRHL